MKYKHLFRSSLTLSIVSAVAAVCLVNSQVLSNPVSPEAVLERLTITDKGSQELMNGTFEAAEAPTSGKAKIVEEDGVHYLLISSSFSTTDQAPDLQILLDTVSQPPQKYDDSDSGRYVNLGGIQNTMGEQRYPIPNSIDLSEQKSVVIWCRMANATIGFAPLNESSTALAK
ncbi:MAG: DM13 domain-containing protein [Cyanobacteria bacterium P01_A01_bin.40]